VTTGVGQTYRAPYRLDRGISRPNSPVSGPQLADRCSRCFRSVFGETPHRYLQLRRIDRSIFLLRETDRSVTDICFVVGFVGLGDFSRTSGRSSVRPV